jgi:hypothetical protein
VAVELPSLSTSSQCKGSKVHVVDGGESADAQDVGSSLTLFDGS